MSMTKVPVWGSVCRWGALSLAAVACGTPGESEGPASFEITAAEGGTVEVEGATLVIPPGALAEDTTITVETVTSAGLPSEADIVATVHDFGPDGLTFLSPVTLTLDAQLPASLEDRVPTIAWLEEGVWTQVASTLEGSAVSAQIDHFTPFTVLLVAGAQVGGTCDVEGYTACGGNVVGTWSYSAACATLQELPELPCEEATFALTLDLSGTITFVDDGTYQVSSTIVTTTNVRIPKSCFPVSDIACSDIDEDAVEDGDACLLVDASEESESETGTWEAAGTQITFDAGEPDGDGAQDYCVAGDTLTVLYQGEDAAAIYTAQRE